MWKLTEFRQLIFPPLNFHSSADISPIKVKRSAFLIDGTTNPDGSSSGYLALVEPKGDEFSIYAESAAVCVEFRCKAGHAEKLMGNLSERIHFSDPLHIRAKDGKNSEVVTFTFPTGYYPLNADLEEVITEFHAEREKLEKAARPENAVVHENAGQSQHADTII